MRYVSASRSARASLAALLALAALFASAPRARADAPALDASLTCPPAAEPGRVRCEVEAKARGLELRWADVEITSAPENIAPLKGRIGPRDATQKEPAGWRFALALVAKKNGAGVVTARVRAVACSAPNRCAPLVADVKADVRVGP